MDQYTSRRGAITLTDAATISQPDCRFASVFIVTLGGAGRTMQNPLNPFPGQKITLIIKQDATGGRTITTWGSLYRFAGGSFSLSTAASAIDRMEMIYNDVDGVFDEQTRATDGGGSSLDLAGGFNGLTAKSPVVDADVIAIEDSAATYVKKKSLLSTVATYAAQVAGTFNALTSKATTVDNDILAIDDSAAANAKKKLLMSTFVTYLLSVDRIFAAGLGSALFTRVSTQFDAVTTTLANVTGLTATVGAGKTYRFEANLFVTADVVGGSKYAIAGTATATAIIYEITFTSDAANTNVITARQTALAGASGQAGTTAGLCVIKGLITVNAGGTLTVQFAQNAANGTSSALVGSTFSVTPVT